MRDKLTKKRVKVDYEAIIKMLDLSSEFTFYVYEKKSKTSWNRQMLSFLRSRNVDIYWCNEALKSGCKSFADLVVYCGSYKAVLEYCYGV